MIKALLDESRTIAVVGLSPKNGRPSNRVGRYLLAAGYTVVPVNPGQERIFELPCYPDLARIPYAVDIVDVFRPSEAVPPIVEQAVEIGAKAVWMQQGIVNETAAARAEEAGLLCIMDRCIKVDHARLFGG